jgi:hypothetical protein
MISGLFPPPLVAPSLVPISAITIVPGVHKVLTIVGSEIALFVPAAPRMPIVIPIPVTVGESERHVSKRNAEIDGRGRGGGCDYRRCQQCERNQSALDSLPHFVSPTSFVL